jgi:hypothetical protein
MERGLSAFAATALTEQQNDGDFAEEEFQFGLQTVLDGIEARITRLTSATRRQQPPARPQTNAQKMESIPSLGSSVTSVQQPTSPCSRLARMTARSQMSVRRHVAMDAYAKVAPEASRIVRIPLVARLHASVAAVH